ncbi:GNAT family N-acetyltransferase [Paludibaculum fermentans]|uniref:GNAT family N-acetyltransferase n=1 Tax=Paludibaculum fermentans TaxID=1473598 RepID=A0A7S7SPL7_PALFE|nr:GNAT family N-acetyltransferase [Paludibaculum fermentans]QOY91270.1 GNAT family N-acetyltransferase [Paludibaculum fermentans]
MIPLIETDRLRMRGHRMEDFLPSAAMWSDAGVTRFIGGRPFTEEEIWARFLRYSGLWQFLGFGYWAVEERATGRFVGEVGFADFKREVEPSIQGIPELGWALAPEAQGKGFATEAARAALEWSDVHLKAGRTVCLINPENAASVRVAEKCGFQEYCRTTYKGHATVMYERKP